MDTAIEVVQVELVFKDGGNAVTLREGPLGEHWVMDMDTAYLKLARYLAKTRAQALCVPFKDLTKNGA